MTDYRRWILDGLLDRYERSQHYRNPGTSRRPVSLPFDRATFPDYWNDTTAEYRLEIHRVVRELAAVGLVEIRWAKGAMDREVVRVGLSLDRLDDAYRAAGRVSRRAQEEDLEAAARTWLDRWEQDSATAAWIPAFPRRVLAALSAGDRLPAGLKAGDAAVFHDLCRVLAALARQDGEVPQRIFSLRVLGHSKALEALKGRVVHLLREFYPGATEIDEADELLADLGLVANPQHVLVSGPVIIEHGGVALDLGRFVPDAGLPAAMIPTAGILRMDADRVVTVENLTSFYLFADTRPQRTVLVYLGGYHNRVRRLWLEKMDLAARHAGRDLAFYHWGDIDLGGFRIFVHLQRRTGLPIRPLGMDRATYLAHAGQATSFDDGYARQLALLRQQAEYAPFHEVIGEMLRLRRRVEQEAVEPPG